MAATVLGTVWSTLCRSLKGQDEGAVTDGDLLGRYLAQRDEAAFEALVQRHGPMVFGVCRRVLRSEADVEDAFQAVFLVLVRKAASIRPRSAVGNWLYGVAHTTALKARAMNARRSVKEREAAQRRQPTEGPGAGERLNELLDQELRTLPDKYRTAIVLCELEGKSIKDAARRLGCPPGTVGTRLARGRRLLSRRLARRGVVVAGGAAATLVAGNAASAAVPASLLNSTIRAAILFAAGRGAAGVAGAKAAALTEGVLKTMLLTKLKIAAFVLASLVAVSIGTAGFAASRPGKDAASKANPPAQVGADFHAQALAADPRPENGDADTARRDADPAPQPAHADGKGNIQGVLEDVDAQGRYVSVTLPEVKGINKKGEVETTKAAHLQDLYVANRAPIWVNYKVGQLSDLKKKMSVTVTLQVQDGQCWVTEIDAED
jgi:RNA polymerase sigma-70 factor (ECF subfamily)